MSLPGRGRRIDSRNRENECPTVTVKGAKKMLAEEFGLLLNLLLVKKKKDDEGVYLGRGLLNGRKKG